MAREDRGSLGLALALVAVVAACAGYAAGQWSPPGRGGWVRARASWYGTPKTFVAPYAKTRGGGEAAFGILEWGGCGYTNSDATLAFPKEAVTSFADANPDYGGSCGRCYEVKCVDGLVLGKNNTPVDYRGNFYYFPEFASQPDSQGRAFPGNPAEADHHVYVKCWDPSNTILVHVVDICPCFYAPAGQAPYYQHSCCGNYTDSAKAGQIEMDMSFWAYERLAHPMYPEMMLDIRPVDCITRAPQDVLPGYVSRVIYSNGPSAGWAWYPALTPTHSFNITTRGQGPAGGTAVCAEVSPGGGMTFMCRGCARRDRPSPQPFKGATTLELWVQDKANPGTIPPLRVTVSNSENRTGCPSEVYLNSRSPVQQQAGGWYQFRIPLADFGCDQPSSHPLEWMSQVDLYSTGSSNIQFCANDLKLEDGGVPGPSPPVEGPAPPSEQPLPGSAPAPPPGGGAAGTQGAAVAGPAPPPSGKGAPTKKRLAH